MENKKFELLNTINDPEDLRKLTVEQLPQVCSELRQFIVDELSVNPGHLASSLGVVEITVALHYVFNTPEDRVVWDVVVYSALFMKWSSCMSVTEPSLLPVPDPFLTNRVSVSLVFL